MSMSTEPPEDQQGRESSIARAVAATGHSREELLRDDAPEGAGLPTGYTIKSMDEFTLGPTQVYRAVVQVPGTMTSREVWMCANGSGGYNMAVITGV